MKLTKLETEVLRRFAGIEERRVKCNTYLIMTSKEIAAARRLAKKMMLASFEAAAIAGFTITPAVLAALAELDRAKEAAK